MSLNGVVSTNGYLEATAYDADAVAQIINQNDIVTRGDSIAKVTKTLGTVDIMPHMTAQLLPVPWTVTSRINPTTAWRACSSNIYDPASLGRTAYDALPLWIEVRCDIEQTIRGFSLTHGGGGNASNMRSWYFDISDDGVTWTRCKTINNANYNDYAKYYFDFGANFTGKYFRLNVTLTSDAYDDWQVRNLELIPELITNNSIIDEMKTDTEVLLGDILLVQKDDDTYHQLLVENVSGSGPWYVDTSVVTQGETPLRVWKDYDLRSGGFSTVRNINVDYEFKNMSISRTVPLYELATAHHTSAVSATGQVIKGALITNNEWRPFDGVTNTGGQQLTNNFSTGPAELIYKFNVPTFLDRMRFVCDIYYDSPRDWSVLGSHDGVNYTLLYSVANQHNPSYTWRTAEFANKDAYTYYKFSVLKLYNDGYNELTVREIYYEVITDDPQYDLLVTNAPVQVGEKLIIRKNDLTLHEFIVPAVSGTGPYEIDTSSVTLGEVPSVVFREEVDDILINNIEPNIIGNLYTSGNPLKCTRTFRDTRISGRTLETKVRLSTIGSKMIEMRADVYNYPFVYDLVTINSITEGVSGSCEFGIGLTCEASTEFVCDALNADSYYWTVDGAEIASGQWTDTMVVSTNDDVNSTFNVSCRAFNKENEAILDAGVFSHTRTSLGEGELDQTATYDVSNIATEFI